MDIEITDRFIFVNVARSHVRLDDAAKRLRGHWYNKGKYYTFPATALDEIRALVDELTVPQTQLPAVTPAPAPEQPKTTPAPASKPAAGWSKAARRRAGNNHPLGDAIDDGDGYTVYRSHLTGGRVQIWDKS